MELSDSGNMVVFPDGDCDMKWTLSCNKDTIKMEHFKLKNSHWMCELSCETDASLEYFYDIVTI